jgi:hypothetical protein
MNFILLTIWNDGQYFKFTIEVFQAKTLQESGT